MSAYSKLKDIINKIAIEYYDSPTIPKKIIYELSRMLVAMLVIQSDVFAGSYKLNITDDEYLELCNDFEEIVNRTIVPPEDM
ncbi:MAG: hypothetical protein PHH70_01905 [Candidatus Gracilibacteria bacterium]|nr:hypothetical protein [Candidatus Gracilibacteria bacterium]